MKKSYKTELIPPMNNTITKLQAYTSYKPSGVEWLGDIPEHWEVKKVFHNFKAEKGKKAAILTKEFCGNIKGNYPVYSGQTENNGIMSSINEFEFDFSEQGCLFSTTVGAKAMTVSYLQGKFSLSQNCMIIIKRNHNILNKFFFYHFQPLFSYYRSLIPDHMQASFRIEDLYQYKFLQPPFEEQTAIAKFLDDKTAKIDQAIAIKQQQIDLLKERRQILIHKAVTQGINPDIKLKDSGVEWIGEIPEHWEVKKCKYLFDEINDRSQTGKEELLSVSHMTGVTPRSEKNVSMFQSEDYTGSKLCQKDDLVYNIMWAWMGALGVSKQTGIVSPSYAVYRQKTQNSFNVIFLENLLAGINYVEHYNKVSTGLHSSRLRFYSTMFFEMPIAYPSKYEQDDIVVFIKSLSTKITTAISLKEQEIEKLKEYKSSLIDGVVTGKVRVC
ncbi:restriction endonuclease subunit S [Flavobacterium sp. P4023]|uniref:Restriction endonuclease subunit S n=1 Tax=Flavobacterium flabelliforme TaxID=2816119 RepID=A0ABS5CVH1_9FLAO|nr:restriction endonuclease subunit S [Flavobacterium flabelliforme]MBP4142621.1 restriction endonuclease subunit S [Flavobacterium flabelliforme]